MLYGMVNQISKFIPSCADLLHPLTVLLSKRQKIHGHGD